MKTLIKIIISIFCLPFISVWKIKNTVRERNEMLLNNELPTKQSSDSINKYYAAILPLLIVGVLFYDKYEIPVYAIIPFLLVSGIYLMTSLNWQNGIKQIEEQRKKDESWF
ncbi:hypothetical protein [Flammeovirga agarivorans]|uniref:DUF3784 domain-containing protein n=1 Tax=Flammeovirga agarivorans TaxID=2726742 RepID=A0A7X8SGK0_9BACT|nr:hypothetical protein [Flammeovirga agarivorans]NLR89815.1 hypothetical protein [Flammeovirga agarivorans]